MGRREEVFSDENLRNPYILSFIVDIMDQSHCVLPWDGTQSSFSDPLKQMIIGVKEHGYGVHLFPCIDTISKGPISPYISLIRSLNYGKNGMAEYTQL